MSTALAVDSIIPNPDQPRKRFDEAALSELATSIRENGLAQPIQVQAIPPRGDVRYMIIAGERRWRAHKLAGLREIRAEICEVDDRTRDLLAIVENLQRADISPLEEGRAFQRLLDQGMTVDDLAQRLGIRQSHRVTDRTQLLRLLPEYLALCERGHLTPSQSFELSRLGPAGQRSLFSILSAGRCDTYAKLRAAADALLAAESQSALFDLPVPTREEAAALTAFERKLELLTKMIGSGFEDNEIVVLRKINPARAATIIVEVDLMARHLAMLQRELQKSAAQAELLKQSA